MAKFFFFRTSTIISNTAPRKGVPIKKRLYIQSLSELASGLKVLAINLYMSNGTVQMTAVIIIKPAMVRAVVGNSF